ncbi:DUF1059 domain-containing protein [Natronococcus jeotgali]|uniref:DUF1059 domain-containing protein n=1 Tax=Natronococcus jeotgali DSM 18795 TaxID=1227498 RepID=L9XIV9_9EURY|nr:DUF1059 domain-containing protein [Natronococcus jeotgali]ELY61689.1 hypothetical protein C492_09315 [Natronococcus jeotgali DSM 18795]
MAQAQRLDREAAAADRRFVIRLEKKDEVVKLAKTHMRDVHGKEYTDDELRREPRQLV